MDTPLQTGNQAVANVAPALAPDQQQLKDNSSIPAGQAGSPWTAPQQNSTSPTVITPAQGFNNTPITVPTPAQTPDPSAGLIANAKNTSQSVDDYVKSLTPSQTPVDQQNQAILDSIAQLTGQEANKSSDLLNAQNQAGVPDLQKSLLDLNNQLKTKAAEYDANSAAIDAQNGGVTRFAASIEQGALQRVHAADTALLAARVQAAQGNLSLAMDTAQKAIDAKYSSIEGQIAAKKAQLDALAPRLDAQQKTQALAQQQVLQDQAQKIADEKATAKDAVAYALQNNVTTPFFTRAGTIYRTSDGKAYSSKEEFFADGGAKDFSNAPEVTPKADPIKISAGETLFDPNTGKVIYSAPKYSQAKDVNGNPITYNESTGQYTDQNGHPIDPTQVDSSTVATDPAAVDAFLNGRTDQQKAAFNSIPQQDQGAVMQLVNGDALLSDLVKSRGSQGTAQINKLIQEATAIDPNFSINTNKQRFDYKKQWNDPNTGIGVTRNAINTGLGHLAELKQISDQLAGSNIKRYNSIDQWMQKEANGKDASLVAQFNQVVDLLAPEIAKVYKGAAPTEAEIADEKKNLISTNPKNVNADLINLTASLLNSKLNSTAQEYKNVMGNYPPQIIHSDVLDQLQASGVNTQGLTKSLIQQGMKASSVKDYEAAFPDSKSKVDQMVSQNPNLSEQDVLQILQGPSPYFNNVGGDTNQASNISVKPTSYSFGSNLANANNNPGNLRYVGQPGASPGTGGFARFSSPTAGIQALANQVKLDASRGHTLASFINKYAPPSENDTGTYIQQLSSRLGVSPNTPLSRIDIKKVVAEIAKKESSSTIRFS